MRSRNVLVAAEVALSFVLLVAAAQAVQNFVALQRIDPGFDPAGLVSFRARFDIADFRDPESRQRLFAAIQQQLRDLPGVMSVSGTTSPLLRPHASTLAYGNEAAAADGDESDFGMAFQRSVLPDYFGTTGAELLEGRVFSAQDEVARAAIAIVDDYMAATNWPGESAIGQRLYQEMTDDFVEVVGVVRHQNQASVGTEPRRETIYMPNGYVFSGNVYWYVRTEGGSARGAESHPPGDRLQLSQHPADEPGRC